MTAETFLTELQKIITSQPKPANKVLFSENCDLADEVYYAKNIMYGFDSAKITDSAYIYDSFICDKCVDCDYAVESQLCYESVDPFKAYNCDFLNYCANIRDSSYCHWCWDSNDLFGCVNLKNKSFCIFNRQLTEAEYREKVKIYKAWPPEKILAIVEELKSRFPLTQTIAAHNESSEYGNYMHYCKKCYLCFDAAHDENCAYLYDTFDATNSMDMTYCGKQADLSYEIVSSASTFNSDYIYWSENLTDCAYIFNSTDLKNCLGCSNLSHKQYCILNRQLTQENYEKISSQILADLRAKNAGWGSLYYYEH
jgi:hypothetical protein